MLRKRLLFLILTLLAQNSWASEQVYNLTERSSSVPTFVYYVLCGSLLILSVAKIINAEIFGNFSFAFVSVKSMFMLEKEGWNTLKDGGWLLLLNYFVVISLGLYLFLEHFNFNKVLSFALAIYFVLQMLALFLTGFVTGNLKRFFHSFRSYTLVHQMLGIALIPFLLIWVLNEGTNSIYHWIFIALILVFQFYKVFRGFVIAFRQNFEWYYIILYLCTLEILPILALMRALGGEMEGV
ncbi:DUF4271 domain-containing protein [Lishizhenia sp.]|uniref:DUF4271 domain-containing protein n=1 Tax=Lishizhenia sp. TaxID=2497594 RepID=UPI00299E5923|nr:DUF4271 domain-containing protein [Lishizhenia sp.]MDX1445184.1 DUF4271 domain-containing protein [Lishizhenia sp.]